MIINVPNLIVDLQQNSLLSLNKSFFTFKRIIIVYAMTFCCTIISVQFYNFCKFLITIMETRIYFPFLKTINKVSLKVKYFTSRVENLLCKNNSSLNINRIKYCKQ